MRNFLLLSLAFVSTFVASGQSSEKLDSLLLALKEQGADTTRVNTLSALYNSFLYSDPNRALAYAREGLQLARSLEYDQGIGMELYHIGVFYSNKGINDSARSLYTEALPYFERIGNREMLATVNHGMSILDYNEGEYDQALTRLEQNLELYASEPVDSSGLAITYDLRGAIEYFKGNYTIALRETLKGVEIFNKLDEPLRLADALGHMASIEFSLENYQESLGYNRQALEIYRAHNDISYEAQALNDIGNTLFYLEDYDQAVEYLEESSVLCDSVDALDLHATVLSNLGKSYGEKAQYSKALEYISSGLELLKQTENPNKRAEAYLYMGRIYAKMQQPERALGYFDSVVRISDDIQATETLRQGYFERAAAYASLQDFRQAYRDHQLFKNASDTIFNRDNSRQIEEMRTIYDTEKKEQQIALQSSEIALLEQRARVSNLHRLLLGGGLLLALIGFYGIRQKYKRNRLEKEKVDAELAFKKKELTTHALHLAKKNEVLEGLKERAKELQAKAGDSGYRELIRTISFDQQDDRNWENFTQYFESVHKDFSKTVRTRYPEVTKNELRLMALLKMNMSSKEIATILNISSDGVKKARQRLRKKMSLNPGDSLETTVSAL